MIIFAVPDRGGAACHAVGQPGKLLGSQRAELLGQQARALAADVI
ncbi:hypothetical protein ACFY3M_41130 [Streptomyces mirabilis]